MKTLINAVVVVTGAGSGIGRAMVHAFARRGARVVVTDVDAARAATVAAEVAAAQGQATAHALDVSDAAAVQALAAEVHAAHGRVDVLVNNAGVCLGGPVEELSLADWHWITDINYWGVVHGVHAFVPLFRAQGHGHIVNVASMAGLVGLPFVVPYCATKFAVVGLSEALNTELKTHGVRVTTVCPGATRTRVMAAGRLRLPGRWDERIVRAFDRFSASPDALAERVVSAVLAGRPLVLTPGLMGPLWSLKRMSTSLYQHAARGVTAGLLRIGRG